MLDHVQNILIGFFPIIIPLVGFRIIFDFTRMILFKE